MPTFAAIDIGSNSVRLKISRLQGGRLKEIHEDREVTRLGEGVFSGGLLSPEAMSETVRVLRRFNRAIQECVTDSVRVVATAALRDARNSRAFVEWVRSTTGWTIEIISGLEEARLIHLGIVSAGRLGAHRVLLLDLGGGSCEVTLSRGGHLLDTVSLPLGAVRLTGEFLKHDPPRKNELKRLQEFVAREVARIQDRIRAAHVGTVIATSGTAAALVGAANRMAGTKKSRVSTYATREMIRRLAKQISHLPLEQRRKVPGIGPRRAEIICAGAMAYTELLERCHLPGFRYSALGLRDGILAQMAAEYDRSTRSGRAIESERWESIRRAVDHYRVDMHHALHVRDAALVLFSSLKSVHHLPPEYREWLSAAAMLYEVGDYVNRNGHHRHTYYIIANSEILGYTPQQRKIIGSIARYLGKSRPTPGDGPLSALSPEEQENVTKASVLLRIARALNMGRSQAVGKVAVSARNGRVSMKLTPRGKASVDLEVWSIEKDGSYFREVFGRELSVAAA
ncbi:MAG: Ppx/GppA phosphatase family protein [Terriglobales bacterium]|jgi:exopolyphosphatase / guanosine-5'-triphosphate,3'-diphosphate pyrophosphatase